MLIFRRLYRTDSENGFRRLFVRGTIISNNWCVTISIDSSMGSKSRLIILEDGGYFY